MAMFLVNLESIFGANVANFYFLLTNNDLEVDPA